MIKFKKILTFLALFLLASMFLGTLIHGVTAENIHDCPCEKSTCALCVIGRSPFSTPLIAAASLFLAFFALRYAIGTPIKPFCSPCRVFPMLC